MMGNRKINLFLIGYILLFFPGLMLYLTGRGFDFLMLFWPIALLLSLVNLLVSGSFFIGSLTDKNNKSPVLYLMLVLYFLISFYYTFNIDKALAYGIKHRIQARVDLDELHQWYCSLNITADYSPVVIDSKQWPKTLKDLKPIFVAVNTRDKTLLVLCSNRSGFILSREPFHNPEIPQGMILNKYAYVVSYVKSS